MLSIIGSCKRPNHSNCASKESSGISKERLVETTMLLHSCSSLFLLCLGIFAADAFSKIAYRSDKRLFGSKTKIQSTRREILYTVGALSTTLPPLVSNALTGEETDLTTQLFNADGSLKEGQVEEAKQRYVEFKWDGSDQGLLNEDGVNTAGITSGSQFRLSYEFPEKWSDGKNGDEIYFDRSEGTNAKACKRVTIFQAPGTADLTRLQKATSIGVAKALDVPGTLKRLYKADIISGRVTKKDGQSYFEFDMAAAPETCGNSQENLGLGFCPYDNIYLLSATIMQDKLFCIVVECDSTKIWKIASSDLKRMRSSFKVENA